MTQQVPEKLMLAGEQLYAEFHSDPLESVSFMALGMGTDAPEPPQYHSDIRHMTRAEFDRRDKDNWIFCSTACWRGYIGTWRITKGFLQLFSISGLYVKRTDQPIFASWVSCTVTAPMGKALLSRSMLPSVCDQELSIRIEQGCVVASTLMDNYTSCPKWLREESRRERARFRRLGCAESYPILSVAGLSRELGVVEQVSRTSEWWDRQASER